MERIKAFLAVPKNRQYTYNAIRALVVLLVASGFIFPGLDETIMLLVAAVLGFGANELASHNVEAPTQDEDGEDLLGE